MNEVKTLGLVSAWNSKGKMFRFSNKPRMPMQTLEMMPVVAAIQYSLAYMLCGGGVMGAIAIFIGAKLLGK